MRPYFSNQRGAALILILFVVVFLSIVGTTLLNTTTYNLKTVVKNKSEQEEFYRAEGALEVVLTEMAHYVDTKGNSGPYFYLYDKKAPNNPYIIGSQDMNVTVHVDPSTPVVDPSTLTPGTNRPINIELVAKNRFDSRIERKLEFVTTLTIPTQGTVNISNKAINYVDDSIDKQDNYEIPINSRNQMSSQMYKNILISQGIDWSTFNEYPSKTSSYEFPTGTTTKINSIKISGNGEQIYIPIGAIAIVNSIAFTGKGNSDYSIKVDGVLIVRDLFINGNGKLVVNSGIITNRIWGNSNSARITGTANGIDCKLLPIACNVPTNGSGGMSAPYNTDVSSIDFSTQRN